MNTERQTDRFQHAPVDWQALLPMGSSVPVFARHIQLWLQHENGHVIDEVCNALRSGAAVRVKAVPPNRTQPWSVRCRAIHDHSLLFRASDGALVASDEAPDPYDLYDLEEFEELRGGRSPAEEGEASRCSERLAEPDEEPPGRDDDRDP